jgi:hypothetical protein
LYAAGGTNTIAGISAFPFVARINIAKGSYLNPYRWIKYYESSSPLGPKFSHASAIVVKNDFVYVVLKADDTSPVA